MGMVDAMDDQYAYWNGRDGLEIQWYLQKAWMELEG
jgi:hypothetical protein